MIKLLKKLFCICKCNNILKKENGEWQLGYKKYKQFCKDCGNSSFPEIWDMNCTHNYFKSIVFDIWRGWIECKECIYCRNKKDYGEIVIPTENYKKYLEKLETEKIWTFL